MQRRELLKAMLAAGLIPAGLSTPVRAESTRYEGPVYITVFAEGGWDVTSLCDPKSGTRLNPDSGETVWINQWAQQGGQVQTNAQGHEYAPFADNARLFDTLGARMLVINGLDAQTNAHNAGVRHTFSGRFADGYPALTALAAARHGAGLPLAFLSNGGYRETAGLTQFTLMQDPNTLRDLINPNHPTWVDTQYHRPKSLDVIQQARAARLSRLQGRTALTDRLSDAARFLESSRAGRDQLTALNDFMPATLAPTTDSEGRWQPILRQVQLALVSAAAGLTVSADIVQWGFDTHANHDVDQAIRLTHLTDGLVYLWQQAAELDQTHGTNLTGRLRVVVASDFGRTPWYNDGLGKDHWPIGSAMLMRDDGFPRAVVGGTNAAHDVLGLNADLSVNPDPDVDPGRVIRPAHLQQLLRYWADVDAYAADFPLDTGSLDLRSLV